MDLPLLLPPGQQARVNQNLFYDTGGLHGRPALVNVPGLSGFGQSGGSGVPNGEVRGIYQNPTTGVIYAVVGGYLMKGTGSGTSITWSDYDDLTGSTSLGTTGQVWMAQNEAGDLLITNGTGLKHYDGSTVTDITTNPPGVGPLVYLDKMFLIASGHTFTPSDVDAYDWDDFDGATPSGAIDSILNLVSANRQVHVFGQTSKETFYNTGDSTAPLARIQGSMVEIGSSGPRSHAVMGDSIYWLTDTGKVARTAGVGGYEIVSNPTIEAVWSTYTDHSTAIGLALTYAGHDWYVLTFPTTDRSFVFDLQTHNLGLFPWWQWSHPSYPIRASANCAALVKVGNKTYSVIGHPTLKYFAYLNAAAYTDYGSSNFRTYWYPPAVRSGRQSITHGCFELELLEGTGSAIWYLYYYDNHGNTQFSTSAITMVDEDYDQRFRWFQLGSSNDREYFVYSASNVQRVIFGATLRLSGGVP